MVHSFARNPAGDVVGVRGERVAWVQLLGDSSALLVAVGPNGAPQRVATVRGRLSQAAWSPDGSSIAAGYTAPNAGSRYAMFVVGVTPGGQPSGSPKIIPAGPQSGLGIKWLPDGRAVTVFGLDQGTGIWLVSLRDGVSPVRPTRDESAIIQSYSLSPDGKYIAYPAEMPRGSSIWRIELPRPR